MKTSIIIINKNDEGIRDTLKSLVSLISNSTEIVVVDASDHKLDWIKQKFPKVRWIEFTPKNPSKISIPEQRNVGVKSAKGDVIVFLDASCVPENSEWLKNLTKPIFEEEEKIVRGASSYVGEHVSITEKIGNKNYVNESPTLNMAIEKSVFSEIGGFDESFSYGSDMDFAWRAIHRGHKIRYIQKALVSHEVSTTTKNIKRYVYYGKARAKLYLNHPYNIYRIKDYELKSLVYFFILLFSPIVILYPLYVLVLIGLFLIQVPAGNPLRETTERCAFAFGLIQGFVSEVFFRV